MDEAGWTIERGSRLGKGGFATVYLGRAPDGRPVAAKVVPKQAGADRELLMEDLPASPHIVPLLHVMELDDAWVLFMPIAEMSLRDRMQADPIEIPEALQIMREISAGLAVIHEKMVHRDLKPENVLLLDGHWAVSDFGISRYIDASTEEATHKFSMTPPYASPEQWRFERVTPASDVYALGVLSYELIGGKRPFLGPEREHFREQHLTEIPPPIEAPRAIATLIEEALFKAPEARPTIPNVQARLERAEKIVDTPGASALLAAQQRAISDQAAAQALHERERAEDARRESLRNSAKVILDRFLNELIEHIASLAPQTAIRERSKTKTLTLGLAKMDVTFFQPNFPRQGAPAEILAYASIKIEDLRSHRSRGHSLYYGNLLAAGTYGWYELGFITYPPNFEHEPRALPPEQGSEALDAVFRRTQLGWGIRPLDDLSIDSFIERWSELFGTTALTGLARLSQLPDGPLTPVPRR